MILDKDVAVTQVTAWIADASEALGLFPSVIKSGEAWSPICDAVREKARIAVTELGALALSHVAPKDVAATPAGMMAWLGGNSIPDDWDGGPVLVSDGRILTLTKPYTARRWWDEGDCADIIAYTPRTLPEPIALPERGFLSAIHAATPTGQWIAIQHHADGDWSVAAHPLPWLPGGEVAQPTLPEPIAGGAVDREEVGRTICLAMGDDPEREGPWASWFDDSLYADAADAILRLLTQSAPAAQSPDAQDRGA